MEEEKRSPYAHSHLLSLSSSRCCPFALSPRPPGRTQWRDWNYYNRTDFHDVEDTLLRDYAARGQWDGCEAA